MNYDVIMNRNQEKVGVGTFSRVSKEGFAQKFGMDPSVVYQGNFKRMGNMLRKSAPGHTYTYSSVAGELDLMLLIPLSDLEDELGYLHTDQDGQMTFYPTDYHAQKAGLDLSECTPLPLSMAVQLAGIKSPAPMVQAIRKALLGGKK